ncbi:MAG: NUDIX hydrolase [Pirellulaceae bacterium]
MSNPLTPQNVADRKVFDGIRFNVHELEYPAADGTLVRRHVARHPGAVVIVPLLSKDQVVLIQNTRPSVHRTLLELPAGTREPSESPETTAARELIEETGYTAGKLTLGLQFYASPGITDERMHLFIAEDLEEGEHAREPGEWIQNQIVSWDQIDQMFDRGEFEDGKTITGLLWTRRWLARRRTNE